MQACKACGVQHPLADFEAYTVNGAVKHRLECKAARQSKRKQAVSKARAEDNAVDPATVPLPERCAKCGVGPPEASFKWRTDLKKACWRSVCNKCISVNADGVSHSTAYREREMSKDAKKFRARNAATHLAWAHRNHDKTQKTQP
jgi:hypothetical protein